MFIDIPSYVHENNRGTCACTCIYIHVLCVGACVHIAKYDPLLLLWPVGDVCKGMHTLCSLPTPLYIQYTYNVQCICILCVCVTYGSDNGREPLMVKATPKTQAKIGFMTPTLDDRERYIN